MIVLAKTFIDPLAKHVFGLKDFIFPLWSGMHYWQLIKQKEAERIENAYSCVITEWKDSIGANIDRQIFS